MERGTLAGARIWAGSAWASEGRGREGKGGKCWVERTPLDLEKSGNVYTGYKAKEKKSYLKVRGV